jgi:hypothetical protein
MSLRQQFLAKQFLAIISVACLVGVASALAAGQTQAVAATPITGQFPIEDHIGVLEPESTVCGFPVRLDLTGQGIFQIFFDKLGNPTGANVLVHISGTLSANGIELRSSSSDNKFYSFGSNTLAEVGLVFRYSGPAVGVVLMDRGRLIWNIDDTGEMVGPPRFEAGPHPELHGDFGGLCAALTH